MILHVLPSLWDEILVSEVSHWDCSLCSLLIASFLLMFLTNVSLGKYFTLQVGFAVVSIRKDVLVELLWFRRKEDSDMKLLSNLYKIWSKWLGSHALVSVLCRPDVLTCKPYCKIGVFGVFRKEERNSILEGFGYFQDFCRVLSSAPCFIYYNVGSYKFF